MTTQSSPTDNPQSPTASWTLEKQRKFLEALARCGSVKAAAQREPRPLAGISDQELINRLAMHRERERIEATAPEDIDISDLDPVEADYWDDLQWARAERSGMMDEPGFWEKVAPDEDFDDDGDEDPDEPEEDFRRSG